MVSMMAAWSVIPVGPWSVPTLSHMATEVTPAHLNTTHGSSFSFTNMSAEYIVSQQRDGDDK